MAIQYCNYDIKGTLAVAGSGTFGGIVDATSFKASTDSGININGLTMTRVAANSAIRVSDGLETLGLLRSYAGLNVATTGTFGGELSFSSNNIGVTMKDASGTSTRVFRLNSGNTMYIGPIDSYAGGEIFYGAASQVTGHKFHVGGAAKLTIDSSGNSTFASDITAGSLSKTSDTTLSILTAAESNSILKFRESTGNYGFTQQYQGTGNYFELLRHNNSASGNTIYRVARDNNNITFYGNILLSGTGRIQGIDTVSAGTDAANKTYVDNAVAGSGSGSVTSVATGSGLTGGTITTTGTVSVDYGTTGLIADAPGGSGTPDIDDLVLIGQDSSSNGETRAFTLADLPFTNNTGDITGVTAGTLLDGGGTSGTVTLNVDLSELTTATGDMISTDSFAITRSNGSQFKIVPSLIPNNLFANDAGYTTNTGTTTASNTQTFTNKSGNISQWSNNSGYITSSSLPTVSNATVTITTATGLDGATSFTLNQAANKTIALSLDLSELSASGTLIGTDDLVVVDGTLTRKTQISTVPLSIFNNNAGFITSASLPTVNNATITIAAGTNLTTGGNFTTNQGSNETITINMATGGVGAGTYGSTSNSTKIDNITVDAYGRVTGVTTGGTGQVNTINTGNSNTLTKSGSTTVTLTPNTGTVSSSSSNLATGAQIQTAINSAVTGVLKYQGTWNANTNSPSLSSGSGTPGYYYIVSVAGSTNLDGITDWAVGDWAVFSDQATDAWQKIDNTQVGNVTGSGSSGRVAYWNSTSGITSDSDLTFNGSNLTVGGSVTWSGGSSGESNTAYDRSITGFSDSGSSTTTLTLTRQDGVTLTTSFSNPQGTMSSFVLNTATGLDGGATVTNGGTVNLSLDLSEFTDMTAAMLTTDEFIVLDSGAERRKAAGEIGLSIFSNDAGFITSSSIPSVGNGTLTMTTSTGLDGGATFTANQSGNSTFAVTLDLTEISLGAGLDSTATGLTLDLSEFTDMTATMLNTDEFIVLDAGAERRKAAGEINLSIFNNDSGFTTNTGTVTSVKATTDGNSLGLSGSVTSSGTMTLPWQGSTSQYVRGDGSLNTFPSIPQGDITNVTAGTGMTGGGSSGSVTLNVIGGDGITANADNIVVDSTVVRTTGGQTISGTKTFSIRQDFNAGDSMRVYAIRGFGQQLILNAGESSGQATGQTGELVYLNAESGIQINSSPDNWSSGWAGRNTTTINDTSGNSTFANDITVSGGDITLGGTGRIQGIDTVTSSTDAANKAYVDSAVAGSGSGTVTSIGLTIDEDQAISISNTPITSSGNIGLNFEGDSAEVILGSGELGTYFTGTTTPSNAQTFTNKSGNISQWTNDAGYVTSSGGSMSSWRLTADSGGVETITDTETVDIAGDTGISTSRSGATISVKNTAPNIVQTTITGNAGSATVLQTARTIAGVSFNGSANISLNNSNIANGAGYITSASLPTVNNASISITTAAGLDGAAIFTTNQSFNETISLSLDLSELTDMTAAMLGTDEFIVLDAGAERRKAANEIGLSIFSNDAGFTTNTGTITGSGTDNQVAFFNGTTALESSANLTQGSGALGELGIAGYVNHIGTTTEKFGFGLSGFLVQMGTTFQTLHVTTSAVKLGYGNGTSFPFQTDTKGIRVQDSIGGGAGTIFLGTGGTNFIKLSGTSVFLNSGFLSPTIELKNTGQLDLGAYTTTNYQAGSSGNLTSTQNFQPDNGVGSDTLTELCVDASGNVVRGSQEATWSFTNAQLNALSNTRVTLLAAPGANKAIVVEESNWFMESTGSNTGTFGSDLTCEIDGISSNSVATQMVKARMEEIAASTFGGLGIYSRDVPELNRVYRFNVPMTIRSKQGTNKFPSRCISIKLKIKYRVFDKATF